MFENESNEQIGNEKVREKEQVREALTHFISTSRLPENISKEVRSELARMLGTRKSSPHKLRKALRWHQRAALEGSSPFTPQGTDQKFLKSLGTDGWAEVDFG